MLAVAEPCAPTIPSKALRDELEQRLGHGEIALPVLPDVAARVLALASREDCSLEDLTDVLRNDPSMAGRMLEIANSAAYSPKVRIVSLQQAVSRLGASTIRDIALVISCKSRVFKVRGATTKVREIFRHSVATAVVAQEIARTRRDSVEEAFVGGLLHDVGQPLLFQEIADIQEALQTTVDPLRESALVDELHAALGAKLAKRWKLPPRTMRAIRDHHDPGADGAACAISLADSIAHVFLTETDAGDLAQLPTVAALNLYPDDVGALLARRHAVLEAVQAYA